MAGLALPLGLALLQPGNTTLLAQAGVIGIGTGGAYSHTRAQGGAHVPRGARLLTR